MYFNRLVPTEWLKYKLALLIVATAFSSSNDFQVDFDLFVIPCSYRLVTSCSCSCRSSCSCSRFAFT